ncbi:MAG: hypothetical protein O9310_09265 [Leptospiraceae bacterium]|nr:hypothetical protein [Leptospiraceae bacterium]
METIILIGIACYTVLRLIELFGKFFFENKPQEIILKPDPRIKGLIDTYKQVSEDLMCDELADSHTAMGASAAYNRVIEDLEGLK